MSFSRPIQWYHHPHAVPIWPDGTLRGYLSKDAKKMLKLEDFPYLAIPGKVPIQQSRPPSPRNNSNSVKTAKDAAVLTGAE